MRDRMLVLENGKTYMGRGFGSEKQAVARLVFNTEMVGYQEVLSDPSYCGNIVVMSYPLIGNYGLTDEDYESKGVHIGGFVIREYNDNPSNFRFTQKVSQVMEDNDVPGIAGVDTREIVNIIRDEGEMLAMITDTDRDLNECLEEMKKYSEPKNLVSKVSTRGIWYARTRNPKYTVVAIDCGLQRSLLKSLTDAACNVIVVPYDTPYEVIENHKPSGVLISSGPGSPFDLECIVETIQKLKYLTPILGVGLGHELVALSYGAKIQALCAGKRGSNIPVMNLIEDKVYIVEQNNSYCVDAKSLKGCSLKVIYESICDGSVEGLMNEGDMVISSQFIPQANGFVLNKFISFMDKLALADNLVVNRYQHEKPAKYNKD